MPSPTLPHWPPAREHPRHAAALGIALMLLPVPVPADVVINEIMYHPPDDRDELQWVELLNTGSEPVDLAGWSFTQGLKFAFASPTPLAPGACLVVSRDLGGFRLRYGRDLPVVGEFDGKLSHGGETITLARPDGTVVDSVKYDDQPPWPTSPDGGSSSLERIVPGLSGLLPENWAPSPLPETRQAAGTPGRPNAAARSNLPPVVEEVRFEVMPPGQPVPVTARIRDVDGVTLARVTWQSLAPETSNRGTRPASASPAAESVSMTFESGARTNGFWKGVLPGQPDGRLLRFQVHATDGSGSVRSYPHPDDSRPSLSAWIGSSAPAGRIPMASLLQFGPGERRGPSLRNFGGNPRRGPGGTWISTEPARGQSALVLAPSDGGPPRIFDHIRITPRQGGWKVRFNRDQPLDGLTTVNVFDEGNPRYLLSEYLAYELYRASGVPAPLVDHWRVAFNGRPVGAHLVVEQPNASFLKRVERPADSDLFKLLWYGRGLVEQHEKKNNPDTGHAQLVATVEQLQSLQGPPAWDYIQRHFRVDDFVNYYAVNMCIQNWDGFFNNYFVYREPGADGRWGIIPWDEDKTWGDHDGANASYDWYTMPLTMGMGGDHPRGGGDDSRGLGFDPGTWWRPPGVFSGPLLANPEFRRRFKARLREICNTIFTEESMEAPISRLERNLESESPGRASGERFQNLVQSFRRQVQHRRKFILQELSKDGP